MRTFNMSIFQIYLNKFMYGLYLYMSLNNYIISYTLNLEYKRLFQYIQSYKDPIVNILIVIRILTMHHNTRFLTTDIYIAQDEVTYSLLVSS
jgi:hypothetical protein